MKTLCFAPLQFSVGVVVFLLIMILPPMIIGGGSIDDPFQIKGFDCGRVAELGIDKQMNLRAGAIRRYCGLEEDLVYPQPTLVEAAYQPVEMSLFGGTDINLITGTEVHPRVTQAESAVWSHGNTIVVAMDDSRGVTGTPISVCGVSVSTDSGVTFTRLPYLFNTTSTCFGDPTVFYSVRAGKWFIGFLTDRCGGFGFGQWESTDGINWTESGCLTGAGVQPDFLSSWVDNNPASPFYGRQYGLFNNFNVGGGAVQLVYSTDDGVNWSAPVTVFSAFRRANKVFGSLGPDGMILVQTTDEGGGGLFGMRGNFIHRSVSGGVSWTLPFSQGPTFLPPGRTASGFFPGMYTTPTAGYWRVAPMGQPGVGPGPVVHYVFAARPTSTGDPGNIFYVRSTSNGDSWSAPLQLNTDATTRGQWQPALAVNARGKLMVTWFDERNTTTDSMQRFGRSSLDNGLTWGPEMPVSDVVFPKPLQPDPSIQMNYVGDRHEAAFSHDNLGNVAFDTWTDGRNSINGSPQQDVYFDKFNFGNQPFDFDGDGKTDIGIFRPILGAAQWWINRSGSGQTFALQFGSSTDRIAPADYTGDTKTDIGFFRPSTGQWFILRSEDFSFFALPFGTMGDIPAPADYDADGKADFALFRPSTATWFISQSSGAPTRIEGFGIPTDVPVVADYDGDSRADVAIFRNNAGVGEWWINRSTAGLLAMQFGVGTDKAVQGDYTGDRKADVAIWRPATGQWLIVRSENLTFFGFPFGANGDVVAPGDYDGDGRFDPTVFRPSSATWFIAKTAGTQIVQFGSTGDRPVANSFVP